MKKKSIYVIVGVILVAVIVALLVFAFSGDNTSGSKKVDINGTWRVVTCVKNGTATLIDNEFMIFTDDRANSYRDGNAEPYASSSYSIDDAMTLEFEKQFDIPFDKNESHTHFSAPPTNVFPVTARKTSSIFPFVIS